MLQNLKIKKSLLDDFSYLPVNVKEGSLGKVKLVIPWNNLSSQSVVVTISDLNLLLTTTSGTKVVTKDSEHKAKMASLALASLTSGSSDTTQVHNKSFEGENKMLS